MNDIIKGKCLRCGDRIEAPGIPGISAGPLVGICRDCADEELLDEDGAILRLAELPKEALFDPGAVRMTGAAVATLERAGQRIAPLLARHASGDWGEVGRLAETEVTEEELAGGIFSTDDPAKQNKIALERGQGRVMSIYHLPGQEPLWVLTDLPGGGTDVLLGSEY